MTYTVLARRYRSRDFGEVVGQESIAQTLQRAVEGGRAAHAYLFCGTRGVGKTTMARILARALNVDGSLADADGIAEAIMRGDDLDVIEIDGASNRGVQEARDLIASAGLSPARCRYRIYIIDEVHMLTTESFNTLLKTMEEPPEHVKFILCTTEPHKVLATIQSRCQRFDFRPIPVGMIATHLQFVLKQEGVTADAQVLHRVASLGNGSMRDALSIMDRLLAGGDTDLTIELVEEMLGLPETSLISDVADAVVQSDPGGALQAIDALMGRGTSIDQALEALIECFRNMMLLLTCGEETPLVEATDDMRADLVARARCTDAPAMVHAVAACEAASRQARLGASARAILDSTVARLALAASLADPTDLPDPAAAGATQSPKAKPQPAAAKPPPATKKKASAKKAVAKTSASSKAATSQTEDLAGKGLETLWAQLLESATSKSAQATLEDIEPVSMLGSDIVVQSTNGGKVPSMVLDRLADRLGSMAGGTVVVHDARATKQPEVMPAKPASGPDDLDDPHIQLVTELFDAEVVNVRRSDDAKEA